MPWIVYAGRRVFAPDCTRKCVRCDKYIVRESNFGKWSTEGDTIPKSPVCAKCCRKEEQEQKRLRKVRKENDQLGT